QEYKFAALTACCSGVRRLHAPKVSRHPNRGCDKIYAELGAHVGRQQMSYLNAEECWKALLKKQATALLFEVATFARTNRGRVTVEFGTSGWD
ncbi:MAG: hypothetical protein ACWGN7_05530, partial [Thermodesulfovibrionales bacterium]